MPEITPSRYLTTAPHWHVADRIKVCIICDAAKPLDAFYAYEYTTKQGKRSVRYESRCRPCAQDRRRGQYAADPASSQASSSAWKRDNRERTLAYGSAKRSDPAHKAVRAKAQRLRGARLRAGGENTPDIVAIYDDAIRIEGLVKDCPVFDIPELGHKMHVDHIIPLAKGGKHVAGNLQVLPIGINMRKGTKCPR